MPLVGLVIVCGLLTLRLLIRKGLRLTLDLCSFDMTSTIFSVEAIEAMGAGTAVTCVDSVCVGDVTVDVVGSVTFVFNCPAMDGGCRSGRTLFDEPSSTSFVVEAVLVSVVSIDVSVGEYVSAVDASDTCRAPDSLGCKFV